jgi:hypothetical protein
LKADFSIPTYVLKSPVIVPIVQLDNHGGFEDVCWDTEIGFNSQKANISISKHIMVLQRISLGNVGFPDSPKFPGTENGLRPKQYVQLSTPAVLKKKNFFGMIAGINIFQRTNFSILK